MHKTVLATATALATFYSASATAETLTFMTGPTGGSWYPLAGAMKSIFEKADPDLSFQIRPGTGLVNLRAVQTGKGDLGFGSIVVTVDAILGNGTFEEKHDKICNIGSMYSNYIQNVTTDKSIETLEDIKGKRLTTMPRGTQTESITRTTLEAVGLSYDDMQKVDFISITDSVNMLKDGQSEVFMTYTAVPSGSMIDLTNARDVKFLPISDEESEAMRAINPGWSRMTIPQGAYPGVDEDVPTVGSPMHFFVNCDTVSEETAYTITKALAENVTELGHVNAELKEWTVEKLAFESDVPFHPGAEKYYEEVGALD